MSLLRTDRLTVQLKGSQNTFALFDRYNGLRYCRVLWEIILRTTTQFTLIHILHNNTYSADWIIIKLSSILKQVMYIYTVTVSTLDIWLDIYDKLLFTYVGRTSYRGQWACVLSASQGQGMDGCWVNGGVCLFASHMNCEHVIGMASFPDHMVFSATLPVFLSRCNKERSGDHFCECFWLLDPVTGIG